MARRVFIILHEGLGPYHVGITYREYYGSEEAARARIQALITYFEDLKLGKWHRDRGIVRKFNDENSDYRYLYPGWTAIDAWRGRDLDGPAKIILCVAEEEDVFPELFWREKGWSRRGARG